MTDEGADVLGPYMLMSSQSAVEDFVRGGARHHFDLRVLRGSRMPTRRDALEHVAEVMEFPSYFGRNWDAVDECLSDLDWLPSARGFVIVVDGADRVLAEEREELRTFVGVMRCAAEAWATPVRRGEPWDHGYVQFRVVLGFEDAATEQRWGSAGMAGPRIAGRPSTVDEAWRDIVEGVAWQSR